jgi:hypothetical protein
VVDAEGHALLPLAACTLPTAEQPLRVHELQALLGDALLDAQVLAPTHVVLWLRPRAAAQVRDLVARESDCCAFFTFDVREGEHAVEVNVRVPAAYADVLTGLAQLAEQPRG